MKTAFFRDRNDAGRRLADSLSSLAQRTDLLILALPRGGVPVGFEVAQRLHAELDILIVRKLGMPGQEEFAMGAIASGGILVLNESIKMPDEVIATATRRELQELHRREAAYRGSHPFPRIENRYVVLVDDGLATGTTMRAAIAAVRKSQPVKIVVAVPVAPEETIAELRNEADAVVCLLVPDTFFGVGQFYQDFTQVADTEVRMLLERAWHQQAPDRSHRHVNQDTK